MDKKNLLKILQRGILFAIIKITLPERNGGHMAKKVYLVDTENVGAVWKYLFQFATNTDDILLFYTENTPFLSYNDLEYILSYKERFTMIKCYTGNNALDFQLVSYLGFLMKTGAKTQYIIVSNDTGYDAMIRFWSDRERNVSRLSQAELVRSVKQNEEKILAEKALIEKSIAGKNLTGQEAQKSVENQEEQNQKENVIDTESEAVKIQILTLENTKPESIGFEYSDEEILIQGVLSDEKSREVISWIVKMLRRYSAKQLQQIHREMIKKYGQKDGGQMYKLIKPILKQFYHMQQTTAEEENENQNSVIEVIT